MVSGSPHPAGKKRILVAEDDTLNSMLLSQMLSRFGYEVVTAADGQEALELFCDSQFHLVLMDSNMPRLNGPEALRQIRAWEIRQGRAPVPIVCLTGESASTMRDSLLAAGFSGYLAKPFRVDQLQSTIEALIGTA